MEEPGGLLSTKSQRVRHNRSDLGQHRKKAWFHPEVLHYVNLKSLWKVMFPIKMSVLWTSLYVIHLNQPHWKWSNFHLMKLGSQFSSVAQPCLTRCYPMDCSTPGLPSHHQLPEFTQTNVRWVDDAIQKPVLYICVSFSVLYIGLSLTSF